MRHRARLAAIVAIVAAAVLLPVTADAAATPAALATAIEKALEAGDADALVAQVALDQPSAMALFVLLDMPGDCAGDVVCQARSALPRETRASRSGRRSQVRPRLCCRRQRAIAAWSPDSRTGGTPSVPARSDRVKCGQSSRPSSKLSWTAESAWFRTASRTAC